MTDALIRSATTCFRHYWIGVWAWELEVFPDTWRTTALGLDEIWVPSEFVRKSLTGMLSRDRLTANLTVLTMPFGLSVPRGPSAVAAPRATLLASNRSRWQLPSATFLFLVMFDFNSVMERKNPLGAIQAFKLAFGADTQVALLIKSVNGDQHPEQFAQLQEATSGWPTMRVVDARLPQAEIDSLQDAADCYVSLHRSEGYGLNLLRNMLSGIPVIATLYSGSMEFQRHLPARYLANLGVGYQLELLAQDHPPYLKGQVWAMPNVTDSVRAMKTAVQRRDEIKQDAVRAAQILASRFQPAVVGRRMRDRLKDVSSSLNTSDGHGRMARHNRYCYWLRYPDLQASKFLRTGSQVAKHMNENTGRAGEQRSKSCAGFSATAIARAKQILSGGRRFLAEETEE